VGLLERLLKAAEAGGRARSAIEIRILLALALYAQGDPNAALLHLQQALALAEPEGYVRMFVDEGPPMAQAAWRSCCSRDHARLYQQAAGSLRSRQQRRSMDRTHALPVNNPAQLILRLPQQQNMMVEPLSERELDVLRLFRTELSGPEIAQELVIALSTVRTHTKSIYSKLNVNSRRAAVKRAAELHLI
jgi:LuxR family transcriptional regulator, maltose regulon positive regulatory protein